jgi:hypothetical protein
VTKPNSPLLELSLDQSRLLVFGAEPQIGDHLTELRIDGNAAGLKIAVLGSPTEPGERIVRLSRPLLTENSQYEIYLRGPNPRSLETAPGIEIAKLEYSADDFAHYQLKFASEVGDIVWTWRTPAGATVIRLEVFPTKLDYREDFTNIKRDVRRVSEVLIADIGGATGAGFAPADDIQEAEMEWLEQVRREATKLSLSMTQLIPRLRSQVREMELVVPSDRLRGRHPVMRRDAELVALRLAPKTLPVWNPTVSEITKLNGHLRWEVDRLLSAGGRVVDSDLFQAAPQRIQAVLWATLKEAHAWSERLKNIPAVPYLPHLQTRLRDPLYGRAFTSLRRLRLALHERESPELLGLKDIWLLYEYWVYLRVIEQLRFRFPVLVKASPSLVREIGGQLYLVKGIESRITLQDTAGKRVACSYNRLFANLPTTNQIPDITVEVLDSGDILVIDAKYRLGRSPEYLKRHGMPGPEDDDINVLHRYRDAIVGGEPPRRLVVAGLVAFPGSDPETFRLHRFHKSWKAVRVGGVPMLPGKTELLAEALIDQFPIEVSSPVPS